MNGDEERNRVLGFPVPGRRPGSRAEDGAPAPDAAADAAEEQQRVLGFPVGWLRGAGLGWIADLVRGGRDRPPSE